MAAFAASFLNADPFLSSAAQTGYTQDAYGNILNADGRQVGVLKNSVADLGSKGVMPNTATPAATPATDSSSILSKIANLWSQTGATGQANYSAAAKAGSSTLENIVFILVGLILIAAAVFSFKPARDVAVEFGKGVAEGAAVA